MEELDTDTDGTADVKAADKPLAELVEHEKELAAHAKVNQSESPPLPETDRDEAVEEEAVEELSPGEIAFNNAKAMIEGPGGDLGTEIEIEGARLEELPIMPVAVDALGRLWAVVDHHEGRLRLVGRVSK